MSQPNIFLRFLEIQMAFPRPLRGQKANRVPSALMRIAAETELFHLAQAIASQYLPELQADLTLARAHAISYLVHDQHITTRQAISLPTRIRVFRWEEIQITPEISNDMALTGRTIPLAVARGLTRLHRQQVAALKQLLAEHQQANT